MPLSRFERADDSPGLLLWQLTNLWQRRMRSALAPLGLTHVQFVLLASVAWLEQHEGPVSQARLAQHAHADVMMTSQVVRALEQKGLLTRTAGLTDSRAKAVALTAEGLRLAKRAFKAVEAADEAFFSELGDQTPHLTELMRRLIRSQTVAV